MTEAQRDLPRTTLAILCLLLGFGLVGIFVGPVVLAVTYTLLDAWIAGAPGKADVN